MPERRQWRRSGIFIVNFERVSIVNFEQLNAGWDYPSIISIKNEFLSDFMVMFRQTWKEKEIYIKIQDKCITHPKSEIRLCEFVLTKLPLTVILKVNFIV